ncbi:MAG: GNAT family N-acetyltransferase [Haloglomus sp.]
MPGPAFRRGETVALHPIEEEDIDFLHEYANRPEIRWGLTTAFPQTRSEAEEQHEEHAGDDSGIGLLIVPRNGEEPVGNVVGFGIDPSDGTAELAAWVAPEAQGEGYATEGTALLLEYLFAERRLHTIVARALVGNEASRASLEKVGFQLEGIQPAEKYVRGEHVDVARYSLLAREWDGVASAIGRGGEA